MSSRNSKSSRGTKTRNHHQSSSTTSSSTTEPSISHPNRPQSMRPKSKEHEASSDDEMNRTNIKPPSLVTEEEEEEEHPLLYLHQSVNESGGRVKKRNGSSADDDDVVQPTKRKQLLNNSCKTKLTAEANEPQRTINSEDEYDDEDNEMNNTSQHHQNKKHQKTRTAKQPRSFLAWLFKSVSTILVLFLGLSLMNSAIIIQSNNNKNNNNLPKLMMDFSVKMTSFQTNTRSFLANVWNDIIIIITATTMSGDNSGYSTTLREEQFERRIEVGKNLLHRYDDASGSASTCESALRAFVLETQPHHQQQQQSVQQREVGKEESKDLISIVLQYQSSSIATEDNDAGGVLITKALLCMGEAKVALFSSSFGSPTMKRVQLTEAKESLEAATAIDPTNPSVRSGLGLSYLLLGITTSSKYDGVLMKTGSEEHIDDSIQFVFQSIQHLKAAVGLTTGSTTPIDDGDAGSENVDGDEIATTALHNLGLAYMTLDSMSSGGVKNTHFSEWMVSLRSSSSSSAIMESLSYLANEGALLLQLGKTEGAVSKLESVANSEVCSTAASRRQEELCRIARQNLAVAREALSGEEQAEPSIIYSRQLIGDGTTIYDEVARWNADAASFVSDPELTEDEGNDDVVIISPSDEDDEAQAAEVGNEKQDGSNLSLAIEKKDEPSDASAAAAWSETKPEPNDVAVGGDNAEENMSQSRIERTEEEDAVDHTPQTPMQNALMALEKAAGGEGPQRTRLLLALARARSSAGDDASAVDAALKAIGASTSQEETEAATLYLESLMDKMAASSDSGGAGEDEKDLGVATNEEKQQPRVSEEEQLEEKRLTTTTFVEGRDFVLSELQLKLELERLKYKVLEQEMMLGQYRQQHQNPRVSYDNGDAEAMRAIDYRREEEGDRIVQLHDTPPRRRKSDEHVRESIVVSKTMEVDIADATMLAADNVAEEGKTALVEDFVEEIDEETIYLLEDAEESSTLVIPNNETEYNATDLLGSTGGSEAAAHSDSQNDTDTESVLKATIASDNDNSESEENQTSTAGTEVGATVDSEEEEVLAVEEPVELPSLYEPTKKPPSPIPPTAKSYMKMADAYLDKGKYALAAKQFLKVIKKAPDHLPAHVGYATAIERAGKRKQIATAALAYGNATRVAILQGESRIDPTLEAGKGGIAESILRRAVQLAKSAPTTGSGGGSSRLETLQKLVEYAHTLALAADVYYEIGMEIAANLGDDVDGGDAVRAFSIANAFIVARNDSETPYHIGSVVELGKIALEREGNGKKVIRLFQKVKDVHMEDDRHVELLVLVGRAHVLLEETETAITEYTRALSFPECKSTPSAHNELAMALLKGSGDSHEINLHFEKALDMGMDPTPEMIEALGERHMSVMRALNRQYYRNAHGSGADGGASGGGGGIMSGGGVGSQSSSVFAPQHKATDESAASSSGAQQSETLALLEQGAASYDGQNMPMGGEVEGAESSLSNLKAKKKQQGSVESNLSNLKR